MRVMVIVKASKDSEAGVMPSEQLLREMGEFNETLMKAGVMLAGEGLHPSGKGVRIRYSGSERTVIDGPFAETKELIAGFWLWNVASMEEAIEWARRCPNPHAEECEVEIRPVFEAEDFGEAFTQELREQEAALRAQTHGLTAPRFEDGAARTVVGINETYTFETRGNIPAQWQRFAQYIGDIPGRFGASSYGVSWNYVPGHGFDYLTGVEVADAATQPKGFMRVQLPACRYAVFVHDEHVSSIPKTIEIIWTKWVPECGLKLASAPCFERYSERFDPASGLGGVEIYLPLAG